MLEKTDSGAGLTLEKLGQLFQPFNRLGQETGIGLVGSEFRIELIRDVTPKLAAGHTKPAELSPQIRQNPTTAPIPVVALSTNAMARDVEKGLAAGFFRHLTKPIKINEFMNALDDALKFSEKDFADVLRDNNETRQLR